MSQYNATEPAPGPRNLGAARRQARHACAASSSPTTPSAQGEFLGEVGGLIADGRLTLAETVVDGGIEAAPRAFIDMLRGKHLGKVVVRCRPADVNGGWVGSGWLGRGGTHFCGLAHRSELAVAEMRRWRRITATSGADKASRSHLCVPAPPEPHPYPAAFAVRLT